RVQRQAGERIVYPWTTRASKRRAGPASNKKVAGFRTTRAGYASFVVPDHATIVAYPEQRGATYGPLQYALLTAANHAAKFAYRLGSQSDAAPASAVFTHETDCT